MNLHELVKNTNIPANKGGEHSTAPKQLLMSLLPFSGGPTSLPQRGPKSVWPPVTTQKICHLPLKENAIILDLR